jgi:hypothetical protein
MFPMHLGVSWSLVTGLATLFVHQKTPHMVLRNLSYSYSSILQMNSHSPIFKMTIKSKWILHRQRVIAVDSVGQNWDFLVSGF